MTLTIEEGKFYLTRNGHEVGPIRRYYDGEDYIWCCETSVAGYRSWTADGVWFAGDETEWDLVAECIKLPQNFTSLESDNVHLNRFECLERAKGAVTQHQEHYGSPEDNASVIAKLWSVVLGVEIPIHKVALCMDAVKTARLLSDPHHADSWIDKAGYAAYGAEVAKAK